MCYTRRTATGTHRIAALASLSLVALFCAPLHAASLPFKALDAETARFTASSLTEPYEAEVERLLDLESESPTDLDVLDEHGWFPMDDVPYRTDTYEMFQWATEDVPQDPLTPEEQVAEESGTAGVEVGIPSPVAVTGTLLGGLGVLASILIDWF